MSKKDENLKMVQAYFESEFPDQKVISGEREGFAADRPNLLFYTFQVGDRYFLAVVRAVIEEETVFPVLEGEKIAEKMKNNPDAYVVMEKGPTGKGNTLRIEKT